jgi:hypothetical protein
MKVFVIGKNAYSINGYVNIFIFKEILSFLNIQKSLVKIKSLATYPPLFFFEILSLIHFLHPYYANSGSCYHHMITRGQQNESSGYNMILMYGI